MWAFVLRPVLAVLVLGVAAVGAGAWIAAWLSSSFTRFDKVVCSWLGGLGLLSLTLFLIGQLRFTRFVIGAVICLSLFLAVRPMAKFFRQIREIWRELEIHLVPALIVSAILLLTALSGLAEITGDWGVDAVSYHLLGPKVWLREGVIRPVPDNCHTAMPQTGDSVYAAVMAFGGPRAPGLSNLLTFAMLLLVAASLAKRAGLDSWGAWWVVALVATMPAVHTGATHLFVDGLYAAFVLAAIRVGFEGRSPRELAIFGLFAGLAMGTKYTGLLVFPVLVLGAMLVQVSEGEFDWRILRRVVITLGVACLIATPYYLRNWVVLGSPIYPPPPLLWRFFDARYLSPEVITQFHAYIRHRGEGLGTGIAAFLLLPFNLTYHTSNFHGAGGIGISALALGPFGVFASRRSAIAKALALLAFVLLVLWFVTQQESRFLIHVYVITAIFSLFGWRYVLSFDMRLSRLLAGAVIGVSVFYGVFMIGRGGVADARPVFSSRIASARQREGIPFLESFNYLNHESSVKRVLILDRSVPPFYLDKDYVKPVGQWGERTLPGVLTAGEALQWVGQLGVSHVLDVNSEVSGFQVVGDQPRLTLVFESENQRIFRVK